MSKTRARACWDFGDLGRVAQFAPPAAYILAKEILLRKESNHITLISAGGIGAGHEVAYEFAPSYPPGITLGTLQARVMKVTQIHLLFGDFILAHECMYCIVQTKVVLPCHITERKVFVSCRDRRTAGVGRSLQVYKRAKTSSAP